MLPGAAFHSPTSMMKTIQSLVGAILLGGFSLATWAADGDAKLKPYPLTTCLVSGEKLGGMGKPFAYQYKDQEIKFCCKSCLRDFNKDPEKYLKKLEAGK